MQEFATLAIITVRRKMQLLETAGLHRNKTCAQLKRVMKLTGILILMACLSVSAKGITQTISLSYENAPLENVLKDIEKQTGYTFFYRTNWVKQAKKITVKASNLTLQQALELCFKGQPLEYSISGKIITIAVKNEKAIVEKKKEEDRADVLVNIKGKVVSPKGEPVAKATVIIKGTDKSTMTDGEGIFEFENISESAVLLISSVGYESAEIRANGKSFINAVLQIRIASLDELQVIGYGKTTRRFNTGNVSTVTSKDIEKQPINNPLLALQGRVPGVLVTQSSGLPGGEISVQIRGGLNSIYNGNDPLYIVDGVPYSSKNLPGVGTTILGTNPGTTNPFSYINPNDIESIDILKDADATAIYGSRGANGVVLITTKKGKEGQMRINVNFQNGWGKVTRKMELLNTSQYLEMRREAFKNDGSTPDPNADFDLTLWDTTRYTDWQKELIGGTAHYMNIQTSVSGGSSNLQYLIGSGYHRETTVFPGNFNDGKGNVHFNLTSSSQNKKLKITLSGLYFIDNNKLSSSDLTGLAITLAPNAPALYNTDGSLNWEPGLNGVSTWPNGNPIAKNLSRYTTTGNNLVSNGVISYSFTPNLELKSSMGYNNMQTKAMTLAPLSSVDPALVSTTQRVTDFVDNDIQSWIIEPQISYNCKIKKGKLSSLIGTTIQNNKSVGQGITASGFSSDDVMGDIKSATKLTVLSSTNAIYKYNALFGRLNFNWDNKYIINATGRRDGSSHFGPASQFHDFWAVGASWMFSSENWVRWYLPFLSYGKLRGSYGTTGSDQIGDYAFMDLYSPLSAVGVPYLGVTGLLPTRIYTPDLAWEETKKMEGGIELGFIKDRILLSASFYQNRSNNQLASSSLPAITGFTQISKNLMALVQNRGAEFELRTINLNNKVFRWNTSFNISFNKNKLVSADDNISASLKQNIGHSIAESFVYHFVGVDPISGQYQFADRTGKITFKPNTDSDRIALVNPVERYYGGIQNSFTYKSFDLDILFQFVYQPQVTGYLSNYIPGFFSHAGVAGSNQPTYVLDRWQMPGDVKSYQKFSQNLSLVDPYSYARFSDGAYVDASYIRLKNVSVSWHLPVEWNKMADIQNARLFIQGQNLLTFTSYKGLDPESKSSSTLPPLRVFVVGLDVTF